VPPEVLFDQQPGALFVVRNAGNVAMDAVLASLESAVRYQNVSLLLVLGHSNCRTVGTAFQAVRERQDLEGHLPELVKAIEPAVLAAHAKHPSDFLAVTIEENVRLTVKNLIQAEPILSDALSGGVHDVASGKIKLI
jgi:carbonic anhydrase